MNFERLFKRIAPEQRDKARRLRDTLTVADGIVDPDRVAAQPCEQGLLDEATLRGDPMEDTIELTIVRDISQPDSDVTVLRARTAATLTQPAASPNAPESRRARGCRSRGGAHGGRGHG